MKHYEITQEEKDAYKKHIEEENKINYSELPGFDEFGRPNWDDYFLTLCFIVSQRSLDPNTKHGCVVVAEDKTILSIGYNGPPRGCIDTNVPLTRPLKYLWMVHSENNAITNAARTGISLKNSTFYITGHPCERCLGQIINVGAKKIVYGSVSSNQIKEEDAKTMKDMLIGQNVSMTYNDCSTIWDILYKTMHYMEEKGLYDIRVNKEIKS